MNMVPTIDFGMTGTGRSCKRLNRQVGAGGTPGDYTSDCIIQKINSDIVSNRDLAVTDTAIIQSLV